MKIRLNRRTLQPEIVNEPKPTAEQMLRKVKNIFYMRISSAKVTDDEIKEIIKKVESGTRNVHYLVKHGEGSRLRDIANYIVRELE